jgi:hypothetical protein
MQRARVGRVAVIGIGRRNRWRFAKFVEAEIPGGVQSTGTV